jgi:hypothetical protein
MTCKHLVLSQTKTFFSALPREDLTDWQEQLHGDQRVNVDEALRPYKYPDRTSSRMSCPCSEHPYAGSCLGWVS